jgi:hypothetical protein
MEHSTMEVPDRYNVPPLSEIYVNLKEQTLCHSFQAHSEYYVLKLV